MVHIINMLHSYERKLFKLFYYTICFSRNILTTRISIDFDLKSRHSHIQIISNYFQWRLNDMTQKKKKNSMSLLAKPTADSMNRRVHLNLYFNLN